MSSGHLQGRLLKMLVQMIRPSRVLEVGTYTGYSALCIAEGLEDGASLETIEIDDEMEDIIRENFSRSSYSDKITLIIGDANEVVLDYEDSTFDLVFMDGNKRDYWQLYEKILPKVKQGGFILADNTLWHGKVLEKPKSNDWQTKGILEFNTHLKSDNRVEKVILAVRDGLTLIRKK
jgi:predicted O-methyltransferase YrrM